MLHKVKVRFDGRIFCGAGLLKLVSSLLQAWDLSSVHYQNFAFQVIGDAECLPSGEKINSLNCQESNSQFFFLNSGRKVKDNRRFLDHFFPAFMKNLIRAFISTSAALSICGVLMWRWLNWICTMLMDCSVLDWFCLRCVFREVSDLDCYKTHLLMKFWFKNRFCPGKSGGRWLKSRWKCLQLLAVSSSGILGTFKLRFKPLKLRCPLTYNAFRWQYMIRCLVKGCTCDIIR